ncbi:MAG TPA: hypothetical protein VMD55_08850 [Terracidiphilus sp.]|nr:hypothetical protein [Terracidiphilus sp.]
MQQLASGRRRWLLPEEVSAGRISGRASLRESAPLDNPGALCFHLGQFRNAASDFRPLTIGCLAAMKTIRMKRGLAIPPEIMRET